MKLIKRKRRDTRQSAGELFQWEQLTSVVPTDIEASEQIRAFVRALPKDIEDTLKLCSADQYNTDLFNERIHRAFAAEAGNKTTQYDNCLHTINTIFMIHRGIDAHMVGTAKLYESDISAAEAELKRINELQSSF